MGSVLDFTQGAGKNCLENGESQCYLGRGEVKFSGALPSNLIVQYKNYPSLPNIQVKCAFTLGLSLWKQIGRENWNNCEE